MDSKLIKNYLYNMAYQVLLIISPVITMPFLSRSLGADGIGQYSYAYTLTSYFVSVATMGCDIYGRREISYVKDRIKERSERFWSIESVKILSTILTLIVYLFFSVFNKNQVLLLILTFHMINVPLNIGWYYQGIEKFKTLTFRGFILKIVELIFILLFIHEPGDLNLYVLGSSIIAFVTFFVLWIDLKKTIVTVPIEKLKIKYDFKNCLVFFLPSIATTLYTLVDKTMLGMISGSYYENGYYEQALKINQIFLKIVVAFGAVLLPRIAYFHKKGDMIAVEQSVSKSLRYVYFVAIPIAFGLSCVADLFVPWFFGEDFFKVAELLKIGGFIIIFQGISDVLGIEYLVSIERQNIYTFSLIAGTVVNFILNAIFIQQFQSIGVICASLISEIVIVGFQMIYVHKKIDVFRLISLSKNYLIAGIVMFIPIKLIAEMLMVSIWNTILVMILGGSIYVLMLYLFKDRIVMEIGGVVLKRIKNYFGG